MSWQTYVDQNLVATKKISTAAIVGFDGFDFKFFLKKGNI